MTEEVNGYVKHRDIIACLQIEALDLQEVIYDQTEIIRDIELDILIEVEKEAEDIADIKNNPLSNATKRQAVVNKRKKADVDLQEKARYVREKKYELKRLEINIDMQKRAFALMIAEMKIAARDTHGTI